MRKLQIILGVCCAVVIGSSSLVAAGFDEGVAVYRKGDFTTALREFRISAGKGHTEAQFYLGLMYSHGLGVARDQKEAAKWYLKAAELGHGRAQFIVGLKYDRGQGFVRDYKEAVKWYRKAAELGDSRAQRALGLVYGLDEGFGQDYVRAHMWLNIAGANGNKDAIGERDIVAQKMTPGQIADAQKLAREWVHKHCQRSHKSPGLSGTERIIQKEGAKPDCKGELKIF